MPKPIRMLSNQDRNDINTVRRFLPHRHPPLPTSPTTLSLVLGVPPTVPTPFNLVAPIIPLALTTLASPIVVLLMAPPEVFLMMGADLGLRTLLWKAPSFSLLTILLAWLAVNIFSFGGEPLIVVEVGLLLRWVLDPES